MKNINNIFLRVLFSFGLLLIASGAFAQQKMTVSGTVKDSKGEPVIGAAVLLEGTTTGAVTDVDGKYSLTFSGTGNSKLVYSSIAYSSQTITVGNRAVIDVVLEDDNKQLDEAVVVGYGSMNRSDLTGSVTSVKIDDTQASQSSSLDQLLQGHAAGVQVVSNNASPDAGVSVVVRGASSFNAGSQPLYVVDGVIINTASGSSLYTNSGNDAGVDEDTNGLMGINPNDIASIEILKDASATAIYGSQGSNGVVLITTKTANKEKPVVNFSAGVDISSIYKKFNLLTTENYTQYLQMKGVDPSSIDAWWPFDGGITAGWYAPVDWQDYCTRTAVSQRYSVSIAARPKDTNYRLSINYNDQKGIITSTGLQNLTVRLNLDKTIGKFKIGTRSAVSYLKSQMTQSAAGSRLNAASSMVMSMLQTRPVRYIHTELDDEGDEFDDGDAPLSGPERWLTDHQNERTELRVTPNLYGEIKIFPWLTFKSSFGADYRVTDQVKFKSKRLNTESTGSTGADDHTDRLNWNWDNLFMFKNKWGKHSLSGTLGQAAFSRASFTQSLEGAEVEQWKAMASSLNAAPVTWIKYSESSNRQLSFFGRAIYNYDNRYVLTATYRFDGSSKFAGANKWAQFPSMAFAWRINQEPWFNVPAISSAKLRLGWGISGNDGVPAYETKYTYTSTQYSSHDVISNSNLAIYSEKLPSYDLKWESTEQLNAGLDLGLFMGRLTLEADWYKKDTRDLLQTRVMPGTSGVSDPYVNMGCITNSGVELTVNAIPVSTRDFEWTIGGNISFNRNRITSIDPTGANSDYIYLNRTDTERTFVEFFPGSEISGGNICHDFVNVFIAGQPMGLFYGLATNGLVPAGETGLPWESEAGSYRGEGAVQYLDINGDGVISNLDRTIIGNPNPDFTFGFNTSFRYKRFTLSAAFNGSYGNDIYSVMNMVLSDTGTTLSNRLYDATLGSWSLENQNAKWPKVTTASIYQDLNTPSDRFVEDGSYLRLANLSLSYDLNIKNKNSFLKGLVLGVSAKNLYVWTNYSGYDPDVDSFGSVKKKGCDAGNYPSSRTYMFDVKFTF